MKNPTGKMNKFSLLLNIILLLFLIIYFMVPFSAHGFWSTVFSPLCEISKTFQGTGFQPGWCSALKVDDENGLSNNGNINSPVINSNVNVNNTNLNSNTNSQIANPAAVKCQEDGGQAEKYQTDGGEAALCIFSDKSICEEWAYFRNQCKIGQCFKECRAVGTRSEGWYNSCTGERIKYETCVTKDASINQNTNSNVNTNTNNPTTSVSNNVIVTAPLADQQLSSPIQVTGRAKAADNKVYVRVKSKDGVSLINVSGTIKNIGNDGFGDFSLKVSYEFSNTKEGFVDVFTKDGETENNLQTIPVKF